MNALDRVIGFFDPVKGLRRAHARAAMRSVAELQRAYQGAKMGRRTDGWTTGTGSANTEIGPAWSKLVSRSRDLVRNNGYARKGISTFERHLVRTGVRAEWSSPGVQKAWDGWTLECDYGGQLDLYGQQRLAVRTWKESGECLVRFRVEPSLDVPLQLQLLEPDHLDTYKSGPVGNEGNFVFMGVEFDVSGRRAAYWLFPTHPGESHFLPLQSSLVSKRVPADEVIHLYSIDRPGQVRGVPQLAVSIMKARDLDDYEEAELLRKKIEACFVAVITKPYNAEGIGEEQEQTDGTKTRLEKVRPASFVYTRYGEDVTFGNPSPSQGYGDYTKTQLRAIAAGTDCTYEQLTGDLSGVNYSSIREGKLEFRALIELEQELTFIPMFCRAVARKFAEVGYLRGKLRPAPDNTTVAWTTPKIDWIDPLKEVMAIKEEQKACMKSISESLRERGYSPEKVFREIAAERKLLAELGLTPDVVMDVVAAKATSSGNQDTNTSSDEAPATNKSAARMALQELVEEEEDPATREILIQLLQGLTA